MAQEIFPNAPIALTACEVRLPASGLPVPDDSVVGLRDALADILPLVRRQARQHVTMGFGQAQLEEPIVSSDTVVQLTDRDQAVVVQVAPDSLVVKTADYQGWDNLRPLISRVVSAARDVLGPDGYLRIGLRYIDEIRLPTEGGQVTDWQGYLNGCLLAPMDLGEADDALTAVGWQTAVQFRAGPEHTVVVRHGPGNGHAVNPSEPPRRPRTPPAGPYFLFDIDSFWETDGTIPEFDPDGIMSICDQLHRPVRALFDTAVTDRLRDEVLRKEPA